MLIGAAFASVARGDEADSRPWTWGVRFGVSESRLLGQLGDTYSGWGVSPSIGLSWRGGSYPWRLRLGLEIANLVGVGTVHPIEVVADSSLFVLGTAKERWRTTWLQLPFMLERVSGRSWIRRCGAAGGVAAWRLPDHEAFSQTVAPDRSRRLDVGASMAVGLEFLHEHGVNRIELGFTQGLRSLYDRRNGPPGSWNRWTLVADVGPR